MHFAKIVLPLLLIIVQECRGISDKYKCEDKRPHCENEMSKCQTNIYLLENCQLTCEFCGPETGFVDTENRCPTLAKEGYCQNNKKLKEVCPHSCTKYKYVMPSPQTNPMPGQPPYPTPVPQPYPTPGPQPSPTPVPQPSPTPGPQPSPMPVPQPYPTPVPQPYPTPEPQPSPVPAPKSEPSSSPKPMLSPGPAPEDKSKSGRKARKDMKKKHVHKASSHGDKPPPAPPSRFQGAAAPPPPPQFQRSDPLPPPPPPPPPSGFKGAAPPPQLQGATAVSHKTRQSQKKTSRVKTPATYKHLNKMIIN